MKLYNTLHRIIEEFKPLDSQNVTLYTCGPTVYDSAHIGNLRTYLFEDLLKRSLTFHGFNVKHVMNITDIDDKTIRKSAGNKERLLSETKEIEANFIEDLKKLNIELPSKFTRATEYVDQMVRLVMELSGKGFAYKADDGSIYFSIAKFQDYGKLFGLDKEGLKSGARVSQDEYDKDNPADFVLWKAWDEADGDIFWDTEIGKGRPGWHIECSAMAGDSLGKTIDIHAGAVDLIFPHHENEIAQSEAANGQEFARYWIHGEHLLVDNQKMSKSLNNFYTLKDIVQHGFEPLDFRYLCLQSHYRSKLNFTWAGMEAARNTRLRLLRIVEEIRNPNNEIRNKSHSKFEYLNKFKNRIEDDLNTPEALAVMWEMMRNENAEYKYSILLEMDKVLGLGLDEHQLEDIPEEIKKMIDKRNKARTEKNWDLSDKLRDEIAEKGYSLEDTSSGVKISRK